MSGYTEVDIHALLDKIAQGVVSDIRGDLEADGAQPGADYGYDLWVDYQGDEFIGVIDLGDLYQGVYSWRDDAWEQIAYAEPQDMIDHIIRKRTR